MSSTILNNTDMMFLLSDYLNDKSAVNLFNSQKSYRSMIQRFPKRYNKKKQIVFRRLKKELKKWNAYIFTTSSRKTTLFTEFDMGEWKETVIVSMKDGEVQMFTNECMLVQFNVERKYKTDPELLNAFKNYFEC
jgi:hypothetical protein